jgi:TonB-linked SusC/RagA family outer membrane protein
MKKKQHRPVPAYQAGFTKALKIMKLTAAFLLLCCLSVSASGVSQSRITFRLDNADIQKAITIIEKKTNYRFLYSPRLLKEISKISINAINEEALTVVDKMLKGSSVSYELLYGYLVVFKPGSAPLKDIRITGTITGTDNKPLEGASVLIRGTSTGTSTDVNGNFSLSVPETAILEVSYVGYDKKQIAVKGQQVINLQLSPSLNTGENVVVVGYGTQKRSAVSGAVADVKLDNLGSRSLNNVSEALQGKAPGVIVTNEGGDPTSAPRVNIRGMGGINGESPLYVVDGSVYSNFPINPNEIESISVLKDAAAAIYGARASGGVIIITTKKGKAGVASITLDAKFGQQSAWRKLQPLNAKEYADVMNTAADNAGKPRLNAFNANIYPDGQITRTNWMDEVFRKGNVSDYNVGISGGTDKSKYFFGYGYRDGEGILLNTYSKRYNFRVNTEFQLKPWLKLGENMVYNFTNGTGANTGSPYTGTLLTAIFYPPSVYPYNADGSFAGLPAQYAGAYGDVINPVAYLKRLDVQNPTNNFFFNPYLEAKLARNLTFRSNLAFTRSFSNYKEFTSRVLEIGKIFDFNRLTQNENNFTEVLAEQTLNYTYKTGDHNFNILAGYTYQSREDQYVTAHADNFDDERPAYRYLQNANNIYKPESGKSASALVSYLSRINYDYQGKYFLSLVGRRDGSSLVAPRNRFANYGSVSGAWLLTKENFMGKVNWLSSLKLRASYGILGNLGSLPRNAALIPLYTTSAYMGQTPTQVFGYAENGINNPDLKWAKSLQSNVGVDMTLFNNRLSLVADYFVKTTKDMLLQSPPPSTLGVSNGKIENVGEATDKGIELGINYNSNPSAAFQYSIGATFTKITNRLESLKDGISSLPTTNINIRSTLAPLVIQTGYPLYSFSVVPTNGIFKSQDEVNAYRDKAGNLIQPNAKPGDLRFVDVNGDGKITNADRVVVGSAYPSFTYGFSFNASYKNFDLNIFLQGVQGNKLFNGLKFLTQQASVGGQNYNMLKDILNAWSPTNPNGTIPRISQNDPNGNFSTVSDFFIESGSYMRVKNLTLGYTLPSNISKKARLNSVRLYMTANNFFTITRYSGFDPEIGMDEYGIDKGRYPQARAVFVGLNVNF